MTMKCILIYPDGTLEYLALNNVESNLGQAGGEPPRINISAAYTAQSIRRPKETIPEFLERVAKEDLAVAPANEYIPGQQGAY